MLQPHAENGPYTWDDFVALEDEDRRELIDGELVEVEVPTRAHEEITAQIVSCLVVWAKREGGGRTLTSAYKVRISERRGVMPDVQFYRKGNEPRGQQQGLVEGHPDLVVEVVSPSSARYDRVKKLSWYASIGVPEYWIVDPAVKSFHRLVLHGDRYTIADAVDGDAIVRPPSFEGLELPLSELWAALDEPG